MADFKIFNSTAMFTDLNSANLLANKAVINDLVTNTHTVSTNIINVSTELDRSHSGNIISTSSDSVVLTLPHANTSKGFKYHFIVTTGILATKWITSGDDKIHGPLTSGGSVLMNSGVTQITMGVIHGNAENTTKGDHLIFVCDGIDWYVSGASLLNSLQAATFTMSAYSNLDASGADQNLVLNNMENVTILTEDSSGWNWNVLQAKCVMGVVPPTQNFIQFGYETGSNGADPNIDVLHPNDGQSYNSQVMAFYDPDAPGYTGKSRIRVIDLNSFESILQNNIGSAVPFISYSQIQTYNPVSITIVYKVGDDTNGGNKPDMETNIKYGRLTAPENLYLEFFDSNHTSISTPTSTAVTNDTHYTSHLESLYSTKDPLPYSQVTYETLQNSPMYKFARDNFPSSAFSLFPTSSHYNNHTTTVISTLGGVSTPGWSMIPNVAQGGDNNTTFYDLVYGAARSNTFIYDGPSSNLLSGIYGAADNNTALWDPNLTLETQTAATYIANAALVPDTTSRFSPASVILALHGTVGRALNVPPSDWVSKTINIPTNCVTLRIFQDRYTTGGNPPNDNYAIGSIKVNYSGTYTV